MVRSKDGCRTTVQVCKDWPCTRVGMGGESPTWQQAAVSKTFTM